MDKPVVVSSNEGWQERKKVLLILAHPDDPDFFCGAMIARWCNLGHLVNYFILTKGQRGFPNTNASFSEIEETRMQEQLNAARVLGVSEVRFSHYMDGSLVADLSLREEIISEIRRQKSDVVVTSDPLNLFPAENRINHPDHRAAGQAVVDAVFPAAGNPVYRVQDKDGTNLEHHQVQELWLTLTNQPNISVNLTDWFEQKLDAISCHRSQFSGGRAELQEHYRTRFEVNPETNALAFHEKFKRIIFQ